MGIITCQNHLSIMSRAHAQIVTYVALNQCGGVDWLNSEKQVKRWPAQERWHSDHLWQQREWRARRDGHVPDHGFQGDFSVMKGAQPECNSKTCMGIIKVEFRNRIVIRLKTKWEARCPRGEVNVPKGGQCWSMECSMWSWFDPSNPGAGNWAVHGWGKSSNRWGS